MSLVPESLGTRLMMLQILSHQNRKLFDSTETKSEAWNIMMLVDMKISETPQDNLRLFPGPYMSFVYTVQYTCSQ